MQCRSPNYFIRVNQELLVPCGRCFSCLINRKRVWQTRVMLEASLHKYNSFVTLTYNRVNLPLMTRTDGKISGTLFPRDLQLFFKRLRRYAGLYGIKNKIRYYAVGEYGDKTWRPHYHICLFGLGIEHSNLINKAWSKGMIHVGSLTPQSSGYVLGYVEKKMTKFKDSRLFGRYPEFARMSNRFGIGYGYVDKIYKKLLAYKDKLKDVPVVVKLFGNYMPLGRYLRNKLRLLLFGEEKAPTSICLEAEIELLHLKEEFSKSKFSLFSFGDFVFSFRCFLANKFGKFYSDLEARQQLYRLNYRRL